MACAVPADEDKADVAPLDARLLADAGPDVLDDLVVDVPSLAAPDVVAATGSPAARARAEPGSMTPRTAEAVALTIATPAVTADSRRLPRRLSAPAVTGHRPGE